MHLVGIPLTGTSVNPARSLGPALFAGGESLQQVWLFLVAPFVGGALAVIIWMVTRPGDAPTLDDGTEAMGRAGSDITEAQAENRDLSSGH